MIPDGTGDKILNFRNFDNFIVAYEEVMLSDFE